jgi:hypothetical protein
MFIFKQHYLVQLGVGFTISGYIVQIVGFRATHSSVTLAQFAGTLLMTALRSWVRRGLSEDPEIRELPNGREQDWLAMHLADCDKWSLHVGFKPTDIPLKSSETPEAITAQRVMDLRTAIAKQTNWGLPEEDYASRLSKVINKAFEKLGDEYVTIDVDVRVNPTNFITENRFVQRFAMKTLLLLNVERPLVSFCQQYDGR